MSGNHDDEDQPRRTPPPLEVDTSVGDYRTLRRIGAGGMAEIWMASKKIAQGDRSQYVVLKVVLPHLSGDPRFVRMFRNEVEVTAMMTHANIVKVLDFGEDDGRIYMVMEWIDGANYQRIREAIAAEPLDFRCQLAAYTVGQVLHGLHYAHRLTDEQGRPLGIVHRDVTPHNILASNHGDVKLTDFGVAHYASDASSGIHVKGKIRYMAPEHLGGESRTPSVDLYAVGALLHELIDGQKFRRDVEDDRILTAQIMDGRLPPLRDRIDPALDALRLGLLEHDARRRIPTAEAALELLHEWSGYKDMKLPLGRLVSKLTGSMVPRTGYLDVKRSFVAPPLVAPPLVAPPPLAKDITELASAPSSSRQEEGADESDDESEWFAPAFASLSEDYADAPPPTASIQRASSHNSRLSPTHLLQDAIHDAAHSDDIPQRIVRGLTLKTPESPPFALTDLVPRPIAKTQPPPFTPPPKRPSPEPPPFVAQHPSATEMLPPAFTPAPDPAAALWYANASAPPSIHRAPPFEPAVTTAGPDDTRFVTPSNTRRHSLLFLTGGTVMLLGALTAAWLVGPSLEPASTPVAEGSPLAQTGISAADGPSSNAGAQPSSSLTQLTGTPGDPLGGAGPFFNKEAGTGTAEAEGAEAGEGTGAAAIEGTKSEPIEDRAGAEGPEAAASEGSKTELPDDRAEELPAGGPAKAEHGSQDASKGVVEPRSAEKESRKTQAPAPPTGPVYVNVHGYPAVKLRIGPRTIDVASQFDGRVPSGTHAVRWLPQGETRWRRAKSRHTFEAGGTYHIAIDPEGITIRGGL